MRSPSLGWSYRDRTQSHAQPCHTTGHTDRNDTNKAGPPAQQTCSHFFDDSFHLVYYHMRER
jgi:hypothetical protein